MPRAGFQSHRIQSHLGFVVWGLGFGGRGGGGAAADCAVGWVCACGAGLVGWGSAAGPLGGLGSRSVSEMAGTSQASNCYSMLEIQGLGCSSLTLLPICLIWEVA